MGSILNGAKGSCKSCSGVIRLVPHVAGLSGVQAHLPERSCHEAHVVVPLGLVQHVAQLKLPCPRYGYIEGRRSSYAQLELL